MRILCLIGLFSILFAGCATPQPAKSFHHYTLDKPDEIIILPDSLYEVSGIAPLTDSEFACIQDEKGIVFIFDAGKKKITRMYPFSIDGDFEGIARVHNSLYILRSDGTLYGIEDYNSSPVINTFVTGIMAGDNEGLCYDPVLNRLLIGSKSNVGHGSELKNYRGIYGFDLATRRLSDKPVYNINVKALQDFALKNNVQVPSKITKRGKPKPIIKFRPSDIDLHPQTEDLYVLSAVDYMLFIFGKDGIIKNIELLDPALFNKAEGLSFLENGDMLITNEGENKKPTLLRFGFKK